MVKPMNDSQSDSARDLGWGTGSIDPRSAQAFEQTGEMKSSMIGYASISLGLETRKLEPMDLR